jgi:hypothetical protein
MSNQDTGFIKTRERQRPGSSDPGLSAYQETTRYSTVTDLAKFLG